MKRIILYFCLSLINLVALKMAAAHDLFLFMSIRGLAAIALVLVVGKMQKISLTNLFSRAQFSRLGLGGGGLGLQFFSAHHMPIAMLAITSRTTPIWFAGFQATNITRRLFSFSLLATVGLALYPSIKWIAAIAILSTFLLSLSQIQQVTAAKMESFILLPFAPACGLFLIGIVGVFAGTVFQKFTISGLIIAILSGLIMTLTYWAAAPLLKAKGGLFVSRIDITMSIGIALLSSFQNGTTNTLLYIGISLLTLALLR